MIDMEHRGHGPVVCSQALAIVLVAAILAPVTAAGAGQFDLEHSIPVRSYPVRVFYSEKNKKIAHRIAEICEERIPVLAGALGLNAVAPFQIQVIPDLKPYQRRAQNDLPTWGIAFAFMESQVMLVDAKRAASAWNSLEKVIPHELSHLLLAQRVAPVPMPLWFVEGLAQWQAGQWSVLENWRLMNAVWSGKTPSLGRIAAAFPAAEMQARDAYRISYAAFTFRFENGLEELPQFLSLLAETRSFTDAFVAQWNESIIEFYVRFHETVQKRYHSRLLIFQTGPLFTIIAVLFLFIFIRVKLRNRRKLKKMERSELGLSLDDR